MTGAVIFDMDGVLLDTERFYTEVTEEIVGRYGKTFDWSIKANMVGRPAIESARYLVRSLELPIRPEDYLSEREEKLAELLGNSESMPGARALTYALRDRAIPIAVATSSSRAFFERKIVRHTEWFSIFNAIVVGDDPRVGKGKPAPDIFLVAADAVDAAPGNCVVIEDSPAGIKAGAAAGMRTVAVPYPGMDPDKLSTADRLVTSLTKLDVNILVDLCV